MTREEFDAYLTPELRKKAVDIATYRLGSLEKAEDIVQNCLVRVWNARDGFEALGNGKKRFEFYFLAAMKRCFIDDYRFRAKKRQIQQVSLEELPLSLEPAYNPFSEETDPKYDLIAGALDVMKLERPEMHQTVIMWYLEGRDTTEITERLSCKAATVRTRLNRGRDFIQERVSPTDR